MNLPANQERRRQPRVQMTQSTRVRIFAPGQLQRGLVSFFVADGFLVDINQAGAFVATNLVLRNGSRIQLELDIPGAENPQPLMAIVARCADAFQGSGKSSPAGLGVRFVADNNQELKRVGEIVTSALTVDLLDYGYRNRKSARTSTSETLVDGCRKHPCFSNYQERLSNMNHPHLH